MCALLHLRLIMWIKTKQTLTLNTEPGICHTAGLTASGRGSILRAASRVHGRKRSDKPPPEVEGISHVATLSKYAWLEWAHFFVSCVDAGDGGKLGGASRVLAEHRWMALALPIGL